MDHEQIMR